MSKKLYIAGLVGLSVVADVGIEMVYRSVDWDTRCEQAGWEKIPLDEPLDGKDYIWMPAGIISKGTGVWCNG